MTTRRMRGFDCPKCKRTLDANTDMRKGAGPKDGDVSICIYCGNLALFDFVGQQLRAPTESEAAQLADHPDIARAMAAVASRIAQHRAKQGNT